MLHVAVINSFANEYTTSRYYVESLEDLGVPHKIFHPSEQQLIPKEFSIRFYIDDGTHYCIYPDPDVIKILYIIDTHTRMDLDLYLCRYADVVYCAQFNAIPSITTVCNNVRWLPLGCSSKWHRIENAPHLYDISFIGGINDSKREKYLHLLQEKFANNSFIGRANKSDIGRIYSGSSIVFNVSYNNDINMRFFEALCSGALLITERIHNNGMEQLLRGVDKPICIFYDTIDEAFELIDYYLENEDERKAIAHRGMMFAESKTYISHMEEIIADNTAMYPSKANMLSYLLNCAMLDIRENGVLNASRKLFQLFKKAIIND